MKDFIFASIISTVSCADSKFYVLAGHTKLTQAKGFETRMSASQERKRRKTERLDGVVDKKVELAVKEKSEKKKMRAAAMAITVVVVVLLAAALFINSNYIRRNLKAITVGGVDFTVAEFNYYYYDTYYDFAQQVYTNMPDYASVLLADSSKPLKSQIYDEETGKTWAEFAENLAIEAMQEDMVMYSDALKNGFTMADEDKTRMAEEIEQLKATASAAGYSNFDQYLQNYYGKSMDEKSFLRMVEIKYTVDAYEHHIKDSYQYTPEELENYYNENSDMLDFYIFRYFMVFSDDVDETDYEGDEAGLEAAKNAALDAAGEKAKAYSARITDEKSFIEIAKEHNAESYADEDSTLRQYSGDLLGSVYGPWLRDAARKTGDVDTFQTTTGHYVVMFVDRSDNHYDTVNARLIHIAPETVSESDYADDAEGYQKALDDAHKEAVASAKESYNKWVGDGATREGFIELANAQSEVIGDDGLIENIDKYKYLNEISNWSEFSEWLYDSSRKQGDHTLIEISSGAYLLYFEGVGEQYSDYLANQKKADEDYKAWHEELPEADVAKTWVFALAE